MRFKLTTDIEFEADNIDDAFVKLSKHFEALYDIDDYLEEGENLKSKELDFRGELEIEPILEEEVKSDCCNASVMQDFVQELEFVRILYKCGKCNKRTSFTVNANQTVMYKEGKVFIK